MDGNNTTAQWKECTSLYHGKHDLGPVHVYILVTLDVLVMLLNLFANAFVIYILFKRNLLKNTSMRLIFYLGISDLCIATITQPMYVFIIFHQHPLTKSCGFDTFAQFISVFFMHTSCYIILLIGCDRYCRLKFLNRYQEVVQSRRVNIGMAAILILSFFHASLDTAGTLLDIFEEVNIIAVFLDLTIIAVIVTVYMMTQRVVCQHRSHSINKCMLKEVNKRVHSMSSRISLTLVILFTPYLCTVMMHHMFIDKCTGKTRENLHFLLFVAYELVCANSFANALIFLTLNKKTPRMIQTLVKQSLHKKFNRNNDSTFTTVIFSESRKCDDLMVYSHDL